ncbi:MAG: hypothetical protein M5U12_17675 [Verrucomicrobia bacterium]|nr:hypothetical protein [Verrucomicrobiota bacterium]
MAARKCGRSGDSLSASRTLAGNPTAADILRETYTVKVSPDGNTLAVLNIYGTTHLIPADWGHPQPGRGAPLWRHFL